MSRRVPLVALGADVLVAPRGQVELRRKIGTRAARDLRVLVTSLKIYQGESPRATLLRAFLYPPRNDDPAILGAPSCEDFELEIIRREDRTRQGRGLLLRLPRHLRTACRSL